MSSNPAIVHVAPRAATAPAPVAGTGAASGDADLFDLALNAASPSPTLAALPPSRAQSGPNGGTGFDTPDSARAASSVSQALSNVVQSASAAVNPTSSALNAATAVATTLTTPATTTTATTTTPATALQSAAAATTAQAAAKANLKQQFAALKAQFQAQPVSTATAALAGMQTTLQNAPNAVSASTATSVTDLLKQASTGVTGGPGAMQARLANLNQQLNKIEARETGVDPSAPPQGWTEPPIFSQARSLLNSLAGGAVTTPAAMTASGDPLATAGLPIAGAATPTPTPTTAAGANTAAASTGSGVAQSAQSGQIAAALQATQATGAVGAAQLDPQMLKAAAGPTPPPLSAPAQTTSASKEPSRVAAADHDGSSTPTVADASAIAAKVVTPATPNKDAGGDNNASLGAPAAEQVADQAAALAKDAKADDVPALTAASQTTDPQAAQAQTQTAAQTQLQAQLAAQTQAVQTQAAQPAPDASHPATAYLAAQMVKQLDGRSTQFDLQLHPADLGRVDVQMRIQQDGKLNAQLAFDNPAAAAEFRGRSDELKQQLQQAGFNLSDDSLTFSERNPQGFGQQQSGGQQSQSGWSQPDQRSRAFQNSSINAQTADLAASSSSRVVTGLDMRV